MAPKKKHAEGIALLSVYSDEDDEEMEDADEEEELLQQQREQENDHREAVNTQEERGQEEREASRTPRDFEGATEDEDLTKPVASNRMVVESEVGETEGSADVILENIDVLDTFLPPPPKEKCSKELQDKISKFLGFKEKGKSFNEEVRKRKDYRNPDFLLHAVRYQDIDQIGSCFSKDVFDPHGYDPSDYYDEIEADMKRERERKEQESKKSQKLDFISGGNQPGTVPVGQKPVIPIPGIPALASGLPPVSTAADSATRDGKPNKKSKWDKVDGDVKNPMPSGTQDSLSSIRANAALLSVASAASGYTAFAQQRRREAEERRSSMERKLERRS